MAPSGAHLVCSSSFWSASRPFSVMLFLAASTAAFSSVLSDGERTMVVKGKKKVVLAWRDVFLTEGHALSLKVTQG